MDTNHKSVENDLNCDDSKDVESPEAVLLEEKSDGDDGESQPLLLPPKIVEKPKRKVQWLDKNGSELAEILEFQPSDVSNSDDIDSDSDSCICRIM